MARFASVFFFATLALVGAGCQLLGQDADAPDPVAAAIERASTDPHRSEQNIARNAYRHPVETLRFFGFEPGMAVLEVQPGAGIWYTEILAPLLAEHGRYVAASYDLTNPELSDYAKRAHEALVARFREQPERYGDLDLAVLHPPEIHLGRDESLDLVLNFRNTHGQIRSGAAEEIYAAFFAVLKPGGVLGVVQHRTGPETDTSKFNGYVSEETVIALAEGAGFVFDAKSEINANPNDRANYARGVWTLPPSLTLGNEDREKYLAIGESDRMTLRFRKP